MNAFANGGNGWTFHQLYARDATPIANGGFGSVYVATHKRAAQHCYAVKVIPKRHIHFHGQNRSERKLIRHYDDLRRYCTEIHVLLRLREDHPPALLPVLLLHEVFLSSDAVHVVTDLLGEELGAWRNRVEECTERMVIDISRTVLNAIEYMHSRGVVHRDMKMNNILFRRPDDFNSLTIVDFGLACVLEEEEDTARILCGTPGYIPPEMYLGEPYRFEVDLFAFGVIVFRLLSGNAPFPNNNSRVLRDRTIDLQYNVNRSDWTGRSDAALDFVHKLIAHQNDRMTVDEAFEHPWFREEGASILPVDVSYSGASNAIRIVSQFQKDSYLWSMVRPHILATFSHPEFTLFVALEQSRTRTPVDPENRDQFWIDASLETALALLESMEVYSARVVGRKARMLCLEETTSPRAAVLLAPEYVGRLPRYTEKDCGAICRQLAQANQTMHDAGLAHRNIHLENVLIDQHVSVCLFYMRHVLLSAISADTAVL